MAIFPRTKNDLVMLAIKIAAGVAGNPAAYPNPPFDPAPLQALLAALAAQTADRVGKDAAAKSALDLENDTRSQIAEEARHLIRLAEATHPRSAGNLKLIGWDMRGEKQSFPPGEVRRLEIGMQGAGTVFLDWRAPARAASVGLPDYYLIERRVIDPRTKAIVEDWGAWKETATDSEKMLVNQPRGVEITYRVSAVNTTGPGPGASSGQVVV